MIHLPLPTPHSLLAALAVLNVLGEKGLSADERRAAYQQMPVGGIYRSRDFEDAERWLLAGGIAGIEGGRLIARPESLPLLSLDDDAASGLLLEAVLLNCKPEWIRLTHGDEFADELMPTVEAEALARLIPSPEEREALLLRMARTFDAERLAALGLTGEVAVVEACKRYLRQHGREDLASRVTRVSEISDQLGYDVVSPTLHGGVVRMEVKTTTKRHWRIVLSRNESDTGRRDKGWALVVCCANMDGTANVHGWCGHSAIEPLLPTDSCGDGRWASASIDIPQNKLVAGVPVEEREQQR